MAVVNTKILLPRLSRLLLLNQQKRPSIMRSTLYGEFGPSCTIFYQTTYTVHLMHVFGFDQDKRVETTVKSYLQFWKPT